MSLWNRITGEGKTKIVLPEPWGVYVGAALKLDTLPFRLHPELKMALPEDERDGDLIVVAMGMIDLDGKTVCRFYTESDSMVQFLMTGTEVEEATLYVAYDAYYPDTVARVEEWVGRNGRLGARDYELDGTVYQRLWDASDAMHVSPVRYQEKIYNDRDPSFVDRQIQQTAMLYGRPVNADRTVGEYLLATLEEHSNGSLLVSMMLGIDIDNSLIKLR